jgi:hypothetical protein
VVGCLEVPVVGDCLVLTEVSTFNGPNPIEEGAILPNGPFAFEDDCSLTPGPRECAPVGDYCPDWFELCNAADFDLWTEAFLVVNHLQTNPLGPPRSELPTGTMRAGECRIFVADNEPPEHDQPDTAAPPPPVDTAVPLEPCGIPFDFDREGGGQMQVIPTDKRCRVQQYTFSVPSEPFMTLAPTGEGAWQNGTPTPGQWP